MQVTGLGKGDSEHKDQQDVQQEGDQAADQAPAGAGEDETTPEFTTSKETTPSGEEVVETHQDDVPVPQDDTAEAQPAEQHIKETQQQPEAAAEPELDLEETSTPATAAAEPQAADSPADIGPMNKLKNMGAGSQPLPKTRRKWKSHPKSWHPDAAGVLHAPK